MLSTEPLENLAISEASKQTNCQQQKKYLPWKTSWNLECWFSPCLLLQSLSPQQHFEHNMTMGAVNTLWELLLTKHQTITLIIVEALHFSSDLRYNHYKQGLHSSSLQRKVAHQLISWIMKFSHIRTSTQFIWILWWQILDKAGDSPEPNLKKK